MTTERNKRMIFSLRMESNHALSVFRAYVLTTVLERSVDHSFRSVRLMFEGEHFGQHIEIGFNLME